MKLNLPRNLETVSGSFTSMSKFLTSGSLYRSFSLQFIYADKLTAKQRLYMIHLDFFDALIFKMDFPFQLLTHTFVSGVSEKQQKSGVGCEFFALKLILLIINSYSLIRILYPNFTIFLQLY